DTEGARAAYRRAVDFGHPDFAPSAALRLGSLLVDLGEAEEARAAFRRAADSDHPQVAEQAREFLADLG
ncbi:tetratricopeptide repeat protein, partial [Streptomyces roseolilacinus]|uniref:tetratricopeptide repeat protein n=1 Tax=Streptomyces roseolilacinus TaxID=66904 RepID=UPI0038221CC5